MQVCLRRIQTLSLVKEKKRIDNTFDVFVGRITEWNINWAGACHASFLHERCSESSSCIFKPLVESIIVAHAATLELFWKYIQNIIRVLSTLCQVTHIHNTTQIPQHGDKCTCNLCTIHSVKKIIINTLLYSDFLVCYALVSWIKRLHWNMFPKSLSLKLSKPRQHNTYFMKDLNFCFSSQTHCDTIFQLAQLSLS